MHVTVVIVAFRNIRDVCECLDALAMQSYTDFDIVICENGGAEAATALRAALPACLKGGQSVSLIEACDNPGYAGGINRCLSASTESSAWWILNPDTLPDRGALSAMVDCMARGVGDCLGAVLCSSDGAVQSYGGHFSLVLARTVSLGRGRAPPIASPSSMNFVSGASMFVSRKWIAATGPMRENYFLYCEEVEWCLRARRLGLRVALAPGAKVIHRQGSTTGSAGAIASRKRLPIFLDERNKLNTVRDTRAIFLVSAIPASLIAALLRYGRRCAWRQLGYALSGWWAGVSNRRGKPGWILPME